MSSELSEEMRLELQQELINDAIRIQQMASTPSSFPGRIGGLLDYHTLEQMVYITEQIRLKLKMLGAPRIYQ